MSQIMEDHVPMLLAMEHSLINAGFPENQVHDYLIRTFEPYFQSGSLQLPGLQLPSIQEFNPNHDEEGKFSGNGGGGTSKDWTKAMKKRGVSPDYMDSVLMTGEELASVGANINKDGTVTLYHRTTPEAKQAIQTTGQMVGLEDGIFFSTKRDDSQATGFGDAVISLDVPLEHLQLDDLFDDEAHVRIPTSRPGAAINIKNYNIRETFVVPVAQMDIGTRPFEPTPMNIEPALNQRDIPEDTVYFGPYGQWKKEKWFGSNDEEQSIYKEPIGGSPNEDQLLLPELQLPEPSCPCPLDLAELNSMELESVIEEEAPKFDAFTNSSSWVGNVRYDREEQTMRVKMNGKSYHFCGVPQRIYDAFKGSPSPGAYVNRNLKKQYTCPGFSEIETKQIRETIGEIRHEFDWLSDDFIEKARKNIAGKHGGRLMLIRASAEAITDHRGEGEPYLRKLTARELLGMARTATGKGSDINHNPQWQTEGAVLDSEYNDKLKQIQLLHFERDPEIIKAIENGIIDAVSINGGPPRKVDIECDGQCFVVPKGVILGETDGIAFTYVVTKPQGLNWHGQRIPPAKPGVKNTAIELL